MLGAAHVRRTRRGKAPSGLQVQGGALVALRRGRNSFRIFPEGAFFFAYFLFAIEKESKRLTPCNRVPRKYTPVGCFARTKAVSADPEGSPADPLKAAVRRPSSSPFGGGGSPKGDRRGARCWQRSVRSKSVPLRGTVLKGSNDRAEGEPRAGPLPAALVTSMTGGANGKPAPCSKRHVFSAALSVRLIPGCFTL